MKTRAAPGRVRTGPKIRWVLPLAVLCTLAVACPEEVPEVEPFDTGSQGDATGDSLVEVDEGLADGGDLRLDPVEVDQSDIDTVEADLGGEPDVVDVTDAGDGADTTEGQFALRTSRIGGSSHASGSADLVLVGGLHYSQHTRATGGDFVLTGGL